MASEVTDSPGAVDQEYRRLAHLAHQTVLLDYVGGTNPIYVGWARPGSATSTAVWRIAKLTYDGNGNVTALQWANGVIAYAFKWDDRANGALIVYS